MRLAQLADEMQFEALVPVGRWRGFGGVTNFDGAGFECFSWAAGIGASTKYSAVFATSHVPTIHPIMAAKQATVIDHISGGRHAINIVAGWYRTELEMFGVPMIDHDARYDMAAEWIEIMMKLWTLEDDFDYDGKYYQVKRGTLAPKPIQRPYPAIMNAGGSGKGQHFSRNTPTSPSSSSTTTTSSSPRRRSRPTSVSPGEEYGRDLKVWSFGYVVQRETEKEAKDFLQHYVHEKGDWVAAGDLIEMLGLNSLAVEPGAFEKLKAHFMAGWGAFPLVGTKEHIVDGLAALASTESTARCRVAAV